MIKAQTPAKLHFQEQLLKEQQTMAKFKVRKPGLPEIKNGKTSKKGFTGNQD